LVVDGNYGAATSAAVKTYKDARGILQPGQESADDIVGIRTIGSLDNEMDFLEHELPLFSGFIAPTPMGTPHDHTQCPTPPRVSGQLLDGHASHRATPINPKGLGRMINIYGEGETDYLGFVDFATEAEFQNGRLMTSTLPDKCANDICIRSAPISPFTKREILRLATPVAQGGCRFTYASTQIPFKTPRKEILELGQVIQQARIADPNHPDDPYEDMEVWVIDILEF